MPSAVLTSCFILVRIPEQTVKYPTIQNLKAKRNRVVVIGDKECL